MKISPAFNRSLLFILFSICAIPTLAQNYSAYNWYFGSSNQGIRFNRTDNSASLVTDKFTPFGAGGSAVASDRINGNLLFYSDGVGIYDATHTIMPSLGPALPGNPLGNQPVAIGKSAEGASNRIRYYVFSNSASATTPGSVSYRIVNMGLPGNSTFGAPFLGDVEPGGDVPVPGLTGTSGEAMITVPHANGEDFWLIVKLNGTPDYLVTRFDENGPVSPANQITAGLIEVAGNFSYHPATGRIAVSPQEDRRDIEIFRFDNNDGSFVPLETILSTGVLSTVPQAIYDTEWNSRGNLLYISVHGEPGIQADVLQYTVGATFTSTQSILPTPNTIARSYGLQMAPDSMIYHLYQATVGGDFLLGRIGSPDSVFNDVDYDPSAFDTPPPSSFAGTQFPSFPPKDTVGLAVNFTFIGTCQNAPTTFFPTVTPAADSLVWDFGDNSGTRAWSPVHTYTGAQTFTVTLTAFLSGSSASVQLPVQINLFDLQLNLVSDTTACACEYKPPVGTACNGGPFQVEVQTQGGGGTPQFQWFGPAGLMAGQTNAVLVPDSAGYYYVVATLSGCSAYAGVNIKTYDSLDQRANIWHFGQNAGIDFNGLPDDPAVAIQGPLNTPEGTSVISDRNGQVVFTTDGRNIFIRDPNDPTQFLDITPQPNPPGLGGNPDATQSALIIPVPGDETLYYIFTTEEIYDTDQSGYQLSYSLFDVKEMVNPATRGLVIFNQPLFAPSTERITSNGNWLIAHEYGNNSFRAYPISTEGIGSPIVTAIGSAHTSTIAEQGQGYMEIGTPSTIAVALSTPGVSNVVELFDFVDSTGVVTNFRTADLKTTTGEVYGIEISPGGNKLFASIKGSPSAIVEFSIDSVGMPHFKQSVAQPNEVGAMQVGPDGQIYVAINNSTDLGTFQAVEDTTQVTPLNLQAFGLVSGTQSFLGLPNFTQIISNPTQTPGATFAGACLGDSTRFSASGKDPAIDKFDWVFGDGQSQTDAGPEVAHLYAAPGTYTAVVHVYNKCEDLGNFVMTVVIRDIPPDPSQGLVLCTGSLVLDANPQDIKKFTYAWSNAETTETITVNSAGQYFVAITDSLGCVRNAEFFVGDNRPQVELGPDLTICQNTPIAPLDTQSPFNTHVWELNDVANGNTSQTQSVDTSLPGTFKYTVTVTDIGTPFLCRTTDSLTYTINESPAFTAVPTSPSNCGAADAQITLTITAPTTTLFSYFITGPNTTLNDVDQSVGAIIAPNLGAGTYGVTVSDQVSGCATTSTVTVNDNAFTVAAIQNGTCDPSIALDVTVTDVLSASPLANTQITYRVINNATNAVVVSGTTNTTAAGTFTTATPVPSGSNYVVEVTAPDLGCVASSLPISVIQDPAHIVTFDISNICSGGSLSAVAAGATSFDWTASPDGSLVVETGNPVTVNPGTWNLSVTASGGTLCPGTGNITVTVDNPITADFTQSEPCADEVTLTATPAGNFQYRWLENGVQQLGSQQFGPVTVDGNQYQVAVVSGLSGCVYTSSTKTVDVDGTLTVALTSTTPCEGAAFTITATPNRTPVTFLWTLDEVTIPGETASDLEDTRAGLYEVTVTAGTCEAKANFQIGLLPITEGFLNDTGIICPYPENPDASTREVVLDPGPGFLTYEWFREGLPLNETTQTITATEVGLYTVNMTNAFGCESSDFIELFEQCEPVLVGPNAFRPGSEVNEGGEFANREFKLFSFFVAEEDFQIFIFNRWGEMVFESPDRNFRWNGGYNNNITQLLPPGTYTYVVKYKGSVGTEGEKKEQRGGVVLLR